MRRPPRRGLIGALALVVAAGLVALALLAPPLVRSDPVDAGRVEVRVFGPDQPFEAVGLPIPTGRWHIHIALDGRFSSLGAQPLSCRVVEQLSGLVLDEALAVTFEPGVQTAATSQQSLDLPAMSLAVQCITATDSFGRFDFTEATISAAPAE